MERLDKLLAATGRWSRREVKQLVRQGQVLVNGVPAVSAEEKYDPASAAFTVCGQPLTLRRYTYLLLHKPAGVLTATEDRRQPTVLELLPPELRRIDLAPVGRLDKDTEGLLLLTNDGDLMNNLLHPSREVSKEYLVKVSNRVTDEEIRRLRAGVRLDDDRMTSPADVHLVRYETFASVLLVTIHEGRNRQVRRMFSAIGHEVVALKRVGFATIKLHDLPRGQWRRLTDVEVRKLKEL